MSPRIKRLRKILNPPIIKGFKPYGTVHDAIEAAAVNLHFEEYEALRLSDYDRLNHHQASVLMGVSRPTFTRIYAVALQKIAIAFVEGRQLSIEGGKVYFDSDWHQCDDCQCYFNYPQKDVPIEKCPLCGSIHIQNFNLTDDTESKANCEDLCLCPQCQYEQIHQPGMPCKQQICPECGHTMKLKGTPGPGSLKEKQK